MSYRSLSLLIFAYRCLSLLIVAYRCLSLLIVAYRCLSLHTVAHRCLSWLVFALRCLSLHLVAYRCLSLHLVAYRRLSLYLVAYRCLSLLIVAYHCVSLLVAACRCLSFLRFSFHCCSGDGKRLPSGGRFINCGACLGMEFEEGMTTNCARILVRRMTGSASQAVDVLHRTDHGMGWSLRKGWQPIAHASTPNLPNWIGAQVCRRPGRSAPTIGKFARTAASSPLHLARTIGQILSKLDLRPELPEAS